MKKVVTLEKNVKSLITQNQNSVTPESQMNSKYNLLKEKYKKMYYSVINTANKNQSLEILVNTIITNNIRNQMVNPLSYKLFNDNEEKLKKYLPETKKIALNDFNGILKEAINITGKFLSGNIVEGFISSISTIKNLLADGFGEDNIKNYVPFWDQQRAIEQGMNDFKKTNSLLNILSKDFKELIKIQSDLIDNGNKIETLNKQFRDELKDYLSFLRDVNNSDDVLDKIINRTQGYEQTDSYIMSRIDTFFSITIDSGLSGDNRKVAISKELTKLDLMESYVNIKEEKINDLNKSYSNAVQGIVPFYASFLKEIKRENPFENDESLKNEKVLIKEWNDLRNDLSMFIIDKRLIEKFKTFYNIEI